MYHCICRGNWIQSDWLFYWGWWSRWWSCTRYWRWLFEPFPIPQYDKVPFSAAQDEENEESKLKRKPWGDSGRFCPVALKESGVLWPGRRDIAVKYREKLYCFSSQANKEMFEKNPTVYTAGDSPLQVIQRCLYSCYNENAIQYLLPFLYTVAPSY